MRNVAVDGKTSSLAVDGKSSFNNFSFYRCHWLHGYSLCTFTRSIAHKYQPWPPQTISAVIVATFEGPKASKDSIWEGNGSECVPCGKQEVKLLEVDQSTKEERDASELFGGKDSDIMYTTEKLDSVDPVVGDDVICSVGRGKVTKIISVKIVKKQNQRSGDHNTGKIRRRKALQ